MASPDPKDHMHMGICHGKTCLQIFQDGTPTSKTFDHVPSEIGAEEAEEVGVEHLLRYDIAGFPSLS